MLSKSGQDLEKRVNRLYRRYQPLAKRYGFVFNRPVVSVGGKPNVVFLGNHSAGKSTFINYLLGEAATQDTGVAPTDDGFTVIVYGRNETEYYGPAALAQLPEDFRTLERLGAPFLRRLRVKVRNRPLLKKVNLIDSPGMIDAGEAATERDYDFMGAVRRIAELSDLVLFLFDPDKPGTTGETIGALSRCLTGMEFKLRILMNKADTFDSMYDFARAYGALCWNLAHALHTKDLPPVYTTYVPVESVEGRKHLDLEDFDRYRGDVIDQVRQAPQRRADNMIAMIRRDMTRMEMHVHIISSVKRQLFWLRVRQALSCGAWTFLAGLGAGVAVRAFSDGGPWVQGLAGMLIALAVGAVAIWVSRRTYRLEHEGVLAGLDEVFRKEYVRELTTDQCDDLEECWESLRDSVLRVLGSLEQQLPVFAGGVLRSLRRALAHEIPRMKSD